MGSFFRYHYPFLSSGRILNVIMTVIPSGPHYQAASSVTLMCSVSDLFYEPLTYYWTSSCTGECFLLESTNASVTQSILRSIDSGNHTCFITDGVGNSGMASAEMIVIGKFNYNTLLKLFLELY